MKFGITDLPTGQAAANDDEFQIVGKTRSPPKATSLTDKKSAPPAAAASVPVSTAAKQHFSIFVGNLTPDIHFQQLEAYFAKFGDM